MNSVKKRYRNLWIVVLVVFLPAVHSRRHEKCTTLDGHPGVCVIKRYCRQASTESSGLSRCSDYRDLFCCPMPTMRSAVGNVVPTERRTTTTTMGPDRRTSAPSREWPRKDDDGREHYEKVEPSRPRPYDPRDLYNEDTEHKMAASPPGSGIRNKEFGGSDKDDYERDRIRTQAENSHESRVLSSPPRQRDSSRTSIRFPGGGYETSLPHPTVPDCGVKPYDLFIAGGEQSGEHEWPWMVAIFRRHLGTKPNTFLCGGSLINSRYVLSAAHCFVHNYVILPASSFIVRLGSYHLDSGEDYTVSTVVVHHNHSGSDFFNDIALVRLASEVYITDKIAPICLPFDGMLRESFVGRMATVAGWGDTSFRVSGTRILQHVSVPIVSSEECSSAYSRVRGAAFLARGSNHVICAGLREGGKDACLGDSGGPLMLKDEGDRWVIIGIVSLGYKCAEPGYPGVYTRVTHYLNWIHGNMKRY